MSEIQIIVPLSAFGENVDLTPEGITKTLTETVEARNAAEQSKERYNALVSEVQSAGRSLTLILDEVEGFAQAQALRSFAREMSDMGKAVRPLP
jgi:hypothetical protein